jgi:CheY-like chemotaxis protein
MAMDPGTAAGQQDWVQHILQGGQHLLGLINEVLDITKIEAGRVSLSLEPVQLNGVVQEVLDLEGPLAEEAGVELAIEEPEAFGVTVRADRQRLRQIVLNLVGNAVKYNRRGGKVTLSVGEPSSPTRLPGEEKRSVTILRQARDELNTGAAAENEQGVEIREPSSASLRADGEKGDDSSFPGLPPQSVKGAGRIRLTVRDTGPGIETEQIGRLFQPFERLAAEGGDVEGTGLGLAIARGLTEAMSGRIGVESVIGVGSAFWIELPAATAWTMQLGPADTSGAQVGAAGPERAETKLTVLYVEDNQPNADLIRHALAFRPGVKLRTALDGVTGLRMARRIRPGLVLLDLNLPDLRGDEVLASLRENKRTANIPVVMVSADATKGQIDRLLAAGARDYLTKPVRVQRLLEIIDEVAASGEQ